MLQLVQRTKPASAIRREDRNSQCRRCRQRQLVQIVSLIESIRRRSRVRVEVELRTQQPDVRLRVELRPTTATRRNELLEAWRGAREAATQ